MPLDIRTVRQYRGLCLLHQFLHVILTEMPLTRLVRVFNIFNGFGFTHCDQFHLETKRDMRRTVYAEIQAYRVRFDVDLNIGPMFSAYDPSLTLDFPQFHEPFDWRSLIAVSVPSSSNTVVKESLFCKSIDAKS